MEAESFRVMTAQLGEGDIVIYDPEVKRVIILPQGGGMHTGPQYNREAGTRDLRENFRADLFAELHMSGMGGRLLRGIEHLSDWRICRYTAKERLDECCVVQVTSDCS